MLLLASVSRNNGWPRTIAESVVIFLILFYYFQVENVLQSASGNYVLCDFGSAVFEAASDLNIQQVQDELNR